MSWLLDTHTFLWMASDPEMLSATFLRHLKINPPELFLSAASAWELAIKVQTGKLRLPEPVHTFIEKRVNGNGIAPVAITFAHAIEAANLPPIHRDPFDRMLAAQALLEGWMIVSVDPVFVAYGCRVLNPRKD